MFWLFADRKSSLITPPDSFRKSKSGRGDSFFRHGSLDRQKATPLLAQTDKRSSWSPDDAVPDLDHFIAGTMTINSLFKQVY